MNMGFFGRAVEPAGTTAAAIPDPERVPPPSCNACKRGTADGVFRIRTVIDGEMVALCLDPISCTDHYRRGAPPEAYAAWLRGELTAVPA